MTGRKTPATPSSPLGTLPQDQELAEILTDPVILELRDDIDELVPRLEPTAFTQIARRLRTDGRLELVLPYATTEQLCAIIDIDAWRADRFDVGCAREWLAAIVQAWTEESDRPRGALRELMLDMDPDLWTLTLARGVDVALLDPEDDQTRGESFARMEEAGLEAWGTPDGFFVVGAPDDASGRAALFVLERLYSDDLSAARSVIMSIHAAVESTMEEEQFRFRSGRLADLGIPSWEDSMPIFKPMSVAAAMRDDHPPRAAVGSVVGDGLTVSWDGTPWLRRVLDRFDAMEHAERTREFLLLVNQLLSAQRLDHADTVDQARAFAQAQGTVSLGYELLHAAYSLTADTASTADDSEQAMDALVERTRALGVRGIFAVGYGAIAKLRRTAIALHKEGKVSLAAPGSLLPRPLGPALAGLMALMPEVPDARGVLTPLATMAEVAGAANLLACAHALTRVVFAPEGLGINAVWLTRLDEPERFDICDLARTSLVLALLSGDAAGRDDGVIDTSASERSAHFVPLIGAQVEDAATLIGQPETHQKLEMIVAQACLRCDAAPLSSAITDLVLPRLVAELRTLERDARQRLSLDKVGGLLTAQSVSSWWALTHGA